MSRSPSFLPDLPDLHNLRDVGGLRTPDGGRVRTGLLHRCATPALLDEPQARALVEGLGLRTRVDVRGPREVAEETSAALLDVEASTPGHRTVHLELQAGGVRWDHQSATSAEYVAHHYLDYLAHSGASLAAFARLLLDAGRRPLLVHCTAGKDRTGTAVAVVLSAVGVGDAEVVADYVRTHEAMPGLRAQVALLPAYRERLADVPVESFGAVAASMELFLRLLGEEYGDARGYLARQGLDDVELDALVTALVER